MKKVGIVPARMGATRFPGKPLFPIYGLPMLQHVVERAMRFQGWDALVVATCDVEIMEVATRLGYDCVMTSDRHTRCLDRVAEAIRIIEPNFDDNDIVVCVQGDEPLLRPEMIDEVSRVIVEDTSVRASMLAVHIVDEAMFRNPDIVKVVHDMAGNVLYTSRQPIPHCQIFDRELMARRVGGIFGFRWDFLRLFTSLEESPLEKKESCDSNRIIDYGYRQRIAPFPDTPYFSVDSPEDIAAVEKALATDSLFYGLSMTIDPAASGFTEAMLDLARRAALAGLDAVAESGTAGIECSRDIKLEADLAAQIAIISALVGGSSFPVVAEEGADRFQEIPAGYYWIVDPLDGSLNVSRGIPFAGVSVGLWDGIRPVLGVVIDLSGVVYSGVVGVGAQCDDTPIFIRPQKGLSRAVLATGFPVNSDFSESVLIELVASIRAFKKIRMFGSAALSLCYVARGSVDLYVEDGIMLWDVAGALPIVLAAGGAMHFRIREGLQVEVIAGQDELIREFLALNR